MTTGMTRAISNGGTRRRFLGTLAAGAARAAEPPRFYTLRKTGERWQLVTPAGKPQFSIGMNHIDPATLRYAENGAIWREKYGNSMRRWLRESVRPNLLDWGFNCVGWTQEVVTRGATNHRHSRPFTNEEYQWLDLPYCHLLPFADFHQWEAETRHPDFFSAEFADWCDHVAREHCAPLANDPKLIGYFYLDCPTWVHTRQWNTWKGPLFDPARLTTAEGREALRKLATQFYKVTHAAVRRYDRNHLILGDRYEAAVALPLEVVEAAKPFVDVLSFQQFGKPDKVRADFARWRAAVDMPILLADGAGMTPGANGYIRQNGGQYRETMAVLKDNPACIGYHLCGAYLANRVRRRGLLDEREQPDREAIATIRAVNREMGN